MPNILNADGLTLNTQAELVEYFTAQYQSIYGADINLASDSPDGQMMLIQIQSILDIQDLLRQIYNSMDPDQAFGRVLDMRLAINNIQRQAGTYTITNVSITTDRALNLFGLDQNLETIFTVQDNAGTQWELQNSISIPSAGVYALSFRAKNAGATLSVPNTITTPVTIVLGVTGINNPTTYSVLGINEESDNKVKIRRQKSTSIASQGFYNALKASLLNIPGMSDAFILENTTGVTDGDGVPSHSIWVITSGSAASAAIANSIYTKRNAGCGMKGVQTYNVTQADGSNFVVRWDVVTAEDLFIKLTATSLDGVNPPNLAAIRSGLVTSFVPGVYELVDINELATAVQKIDPNTLVTNAGFSSTAGGSYTTTKRPATKANQFAVTSANIILLAIILNQTATSVAPSTANAATFSALGGYGAYTFTMQTNVSGGSIVAGTGVYSSGATPGTDVIRVTDALGNFTDANMAVT